MKIENTITGHFDEHDASANDDGQSGVPDAVPLEFSSEQIYNLHETNDTTIIPEPNHVVVVTDKPRRKQGKSVDLGKFSGGAHLIHLAISVVVLIGTGESLRCEFVSTVMS